MPSLTVYKASAGSGKTFTLATEYIKLLVADPQAFRHTLAVTFTNKATEEMKMRILSQLYGIWKGLEASRSYTDKVCAELDVTPAYAARQAGTALHLLLHNYSYFRVETIDSFFQTILRNLARELDLTANLRIGLNDVQVEEMAVDQLIDSLTPRDRVLQWLLGYIMDNISDDRSWNVIGQVKAFGRTIFRDYYKQHSQRLHQVLEQEGMLDAYARQLRDMRQQAAQHMAAIADAFFDELQGEGLGIDDLAYGTSGVAGLFVKLRKGVFDQSILTKRVADSIGAPERWCKKTHPRRDLILHLAATTLGDLLCQAVDEQPRQWRRAQSAELTLRHLSQLRLLGSIEQRVRQLNGEANRFLLSDTQQLLHQLIDGSDSPFIFEKIGTQLQHIMIDEFQDTSTVQWQNFKVLLEEAMSHRDGSCLVVGDVKQSIYRWRSGDWRLLAGISQQFDHADERLDIRTLDTNYRSCRRVVDFNNTFFTQAAQLEQLTEAYDDVCQHVPAQRPDEGSVEVVLLNKEDYGGATLQMLCDRVAQLTAQGVAPSDIAILVRTNKHIPLVANYFMEQLPDVNVVSDEAFRLDASPAVNTIVQALRLLHNPADLITRAALCKTWSQRLDGPLPPDFDGHEEELRRMPLHELCERLHTIFHLGRNEGQEAYLCAFYDQVTQFVGERTTDLATFLDEWDETLSAKTIQSPELDGVRIISIHKSKGLEFPHVLVPFCDWRLEHADVLWCEPQEMPFSQLPIVPIDYSQKGMTGTIYEADYEEEHQQTTVDNLNLLYVAFTRASESLFVIGRRDAQGSRSALLEQVLPLLPPLLPDSSLEGEADAEAPLRFLSQWPQSSQSSHLPQWPHSSQLSQSPQSPQKPQSPQPPKNTNPFLRTSAPLPVSIEMHDSPVALSQSLQSRRFAQPDEPTAEEQRREGYIQAGNVLHALFSTIRTTADIPQALQRLELDGIIYDRHLTRPRLEQMIRSRLGDPRVAQWFDGRWTLFNECTILTRDAATGRTVERRPDRVMTDGRQTIVVDFKFGRQSDEHRQQVQQYVDLLRQMHMPRVSAYLWYVYSNRIVEV